MSHHGKRLLNNRVAIVTGASSGIGRSTAVALAEAGCKTLLVARNQSELAATEQEIRRRRPDRRCIVLAVDVTDPTAPETICRAALEELGRVDILVNNAGVNAFGLLESVPEELIRQVFELNVWAPLRIVRALLPEMKQQGGAIVNISSIVAFRGLPRTSMYSASKAALNAMSEGLRLEVSRYGIDVVSVYPGLTETPMHSHILFDGKAPPPPRRKAVPPERVARAIVRGIRNGERDVFITAADRIFVLSVMAMPGVWDVLLRLLDRMRGR